ncbi:MAG: hypothetical protein IJW16_08315 [Clostridia bacterium]|nr:hypothetical protein [Clostridia bacterium]
MEQFRAYSPEDIILSNLNEVSARHISAFEQELAHLAELARELAESQGDTAELISALPDLAPPKSPLPPHLPSSREILSRINTVHAAEQRLLLCDELARILRADLYGDSAEGILGVEPRVAYQKSSFTDTAFLQFSPLFGKPRAIYTASFVAACEDVYNGVCDYCILPLENLTEGRLISFTKLIDRFGLKIAATCEVSGTDATKCTCFALLSKQITAHPTRDGCYLEIALLQADGATLSHALLAAELCRLGLCKLASIPLESETVLHAVFKASPSLSTFLLYLAMDVPQHTVVGIYPHLQSNKK